MEATDSLGYTPLHCAVCSGSVRLLSLLIQSGVNVDAIDNGNATALHLAVRRRATDCVEVLMAAGASLTLETHGWTPFGLALLRGHRSMWPLFLRAGAELPAAYPPDPYLGRVVAAGGFKKYEQAHITRITAILAPMPRLPPEMVRKIVEFWLHAGYY